MLPKAKWTQALGPLTLMGIVLGGQPQAWALDKQGSAHGGSVAGATSGVSASGAFMVGVALYNPSYAARPDNSGLALMRYAAHADVDLIGRRLSIPVDANLFSDRLRSGVGRFSPSELDVIVGATSTFRAGSGAVEIGVRGERDMGVDEKTDPQGYVDARARYLYALGAQIPGLVDRLGGGDVTGWLTLGCFAYNPNYYARPDNTGLALLRYGLHNEISFWGGRLAFAVDATMFSDRQARVVVRPSELDLTPEVIFRIGAAEMHLAYERDMPLDRGGLVQHFAYLLAVWAL